MHICIFKDADQKGNVALEGYGIGNVKDILDNLKHREYERYQKLPLSGAKTFAVAATALNEFMK